MRDYPEKMGVDILKNNNEIVVVDNRSGHIVWEVSKDKPVDTPWYSVMDDILADSSEVGPFGRPRASYWRRRDVPF